MKPPIYIRTDATPQIGLGHLVRCIAFAQMLCDHFEITFLCEEIPASKKDDLKALGFEVIIIESDQQVVNKVGLNDIVVLDGYQFTSHFQKQIKKTGAKLICIDDLHNQHFYADLVINHSPGVSSKDYDAEPYTKFALGLHYALLRPAFLSNSGILKSFSLKNKLLICLGGSDTENHTLHILRNIHLSDWDIINVVVGVSYPHLKNLAMFVKENNQGNIKLYKNIDEHQLVRLMMSSGTAICSPSSVSIEYLSVSKGVLLLHLTATNQKNWYNFAIENGLAFKYDPLNLSTINALNANYDLQNEMFDGEQAERLRNKLAKL